MQHYSLVWHTGRSFASMGWEPHRGSPDTMAPAVILRNIFDRGAMKGLRGNLAKIEPEIMSRLYSGFTSQASSSFFEGETLLPASTSVKATMSLNEVAAVAKGEIAGRDELQAMKLKTNEAERELLKKRIYEKTGEVYSDQDLANLLHYATRVEKINQESFRFVPAGSDPMARHSPMWTVMLADIQQKMKYQGGFEDYEINAIDEATNKWDLKHAISQAYYGSSFHGGETMGKMQRQLGEKRDREVQRAEFYAARGGHISEKDIEALRSAKSVDALNNALAALKSNAEQTTFNINAMSEGIKKGLGSFGISTQARAYDWNRLGDAANKQWSSVQSAFSWAPSGIMQPVTRMGNAVQNSMEYWRAGINGNYNSVTKGIIPIISSIAGIATGVATMNPMAGFAVGMGAQHGLNALAGLTQIGGQQAEAKITKFGQDLSMRGNLLGIIFEGLGAAVKAVTWPLKLFGSALNLALRGASMFSKTMDSLAGLGNPLHSLVQSKGYDAYDRSTMADIFTGQQSGSMYAGAATFSQMQHNLQLGRFDTNQIVNAAMLGGFNQIYMNNGRDQYQNQDAIIDEWAQQIHSAPNDQEKGRRMNMMMGLNPQAAQAAQTVANTMKYANDKWFTDKIAGYGTGINALSDFKNYKRMGGYRPIDDRTREQFRVVSAEWQGALKSIDNSKMRIAVMLWNSVGTKVLNFANRLADAISQGKSLGDILNIAFREVKKVLKGIWDELGGTEKVGKVFDIILSAFQKVRPTLQNLLVDTIQSVAIAVWPSFKNLIINIAKMADQLIESVGSLDFAQLLKNMVGIGETKSIWRNDLSHYSGTNVYSPLVSENEIKTGNVPSTDIAIARRMHIPLNLYFIFLKGNIYFNTI